MSYELTMLSTCLYSPSDEQSSVSAGSSASTGPSPRRLSLLQCLTPLIPMLVFVVLYMLWGTFSPTDIMEREPRLFLFSAGVVFSNIAVSVGLKCGHKITADRP